MEYNWQPIETAPKNGKFILICDYNGEVHKASWCKNGDVMGRGSYNWCIANSFDEDGDSDTVDSPTFWIPLPIIPTRNGLKEGMKVKHIAIKQILIIVPDEEGPAFTGNEFEENEISLSHAISEFKDGNLTIIDE